MARIMIVDDASFMRMLIRKIVVEAGHTVVAEAENGEIAIAKYKEFKPDLTTMDITMPEKNGIEAVKGIKAFDPDAKIIMCSAMGQQAMVIEAIQAGAKDFLVKPFQQERVIEAVRKVIGS